MKLHVVGEGYRAYLADEEGNPLGDLADSVMFDLARRFNAYPSLVAALKGVKANYDENNIESDGRQYYCGDINDIIAIVDKALRDAGENI